MMIHTYKRGFTAMELLIVIAAIGMLALVVLPQFSKNRERQVLKSGVQSVLSSLDKARVETLSSLNSSTYGVHFQSNQVIIFQGTSYSGSNVIEAVSIVSPASISNVTLGGVSASSGDVYFNRLSAEPNQTGTVTISTTSYSKIITISATGMVSSN
jgi:prepilin-type N-terminal cleavage/methylation domain-containing protein